MKGTLLLVLLYAGAVGLRLAAFASDHLFLDRPELVTPISNIKRVKEALFLSETGLSPYDGMAFHQPPLVLSIFKVPIYLNFLPFVFIVLDFWAAYLLRHITDRYNQTAEAKVDRLTPPPAYMGHVVALLYLYLPFSWTVCAAQSTATIENLLILHVLFYALQGNMPASVSLLAAAAYLALYPVQLLAPLFFLFPKNRKMTIVGVFVVVLGGLVYLSNRKMDSTQWMEQSYGFVLQVIDLTPNIGLFWYFFLEVFDHFRTFFCCVLQLNCFLYVVPLSICFRRRPVLLFWLLLTFIGTLKPYPSAADLALQFGLLPLFYPIIAEFLVRFLVLMQVYLYSFILMPIAWYAWLYQGSGNANFYYGTTLAIGVAQVWLIVEVLHLALERQYKRKHQLVPFGPNPIMNTSS